MTNRAFAPCDIPPDHIDETVTATRHKVVYKDESKID